MKKVLILTISLNFINSVYIDKSLFSQKCCIYGKGGIAKHRKDGYLRNGDVIMINNFENKYYCPFSLLFHGNTLQATRTLNITESENYL